MLCEPCVAIRELDFVDYIAVMECKVALPSCGTFFTISYDVVDKFQEEFRAELAKEENIRLSTRYQTILVWPLRGQEVTDRHRDYCRRRDGWGIFRIDCEQVMCHLKRRYSVNYDPKVILGALGKAYESISGQLN